MAHLPHNTKHVLRTSLLSSLPSVRVNESAPPCHDSTFPLVFPHCAVAKVWSDGHAIVDARCAALHMQFVLHTALASLVACVYVAHVEWAKAWWVRGFRMCIYMTLDVASQGAPPSITHARLATATWNTRLIRVWAPCKARQRRHLVRGTSQCWCNFKLLDSTVRGSDCGMLGRHTSSTIAPR